MGWWPTKLCVLLNLVILLGYSMIDAVVAGQMLSAVSPDGSLTVEVGIIIVAVITWVVTTFGIRVFHYYERLVFRVFGKLHADVAKIRLASTIRGAIHPRRISRPKV
jgi:purine-cytosine permease-like protein